MNSRRKFRQYMAHSKDIPVEDVVSYKEIRDGRYGEFDTLVCVGSDNKEMTTTMIWKDFAMFLLKTCKEK